MKKYTFVFLLFIVSSGFAQSWNLALDTIEIRAKSILKTPSFARVDSTFYRMYSNADLAQLIQSSGIGTANKYGGSGAIASVRNAGIKPEFIAVEWNGMAINSLSLGMADVSLIPSFFIDQASFNESNFEWGQRNTGIGGNLKLASSFSSKPLVELQSSYSSLQNAFIGVKIKQQIGKCRIDFRVLDTYNKNEFFFVDPYVFEARTQIQKHNDTHIQGIQGGMQYNAKGGVLESRFMLVHRNAELPEALGGITAVNATQQDRIFKWSTSFKPRDTFNAMKLEGMKEYAVFLSNDFNNYKNFLSSSAVESSQLGANTAIYMRGTNGFIQNQTNVEVNQVKYSEWNANYQWLHASSYFSGVRNASWGEWLIWFKPEYRSDQRFISSEEIALQIPAKKSWKWKISASQIARFPTSNELYWQPGGNPNLKPEIGSWLKSSVMKSVKHFVFDAETKYGIIQNWIQWSPINPSVWSPMNIKTVNLWQSTCGATYTNQFSALKFKVNASVQYSSAIGKNENESNSFQMVYTPRWKSHLHLNIEKQKWSALVSTNFLSARFTDEANSSYLTLPAMLTVDAGFFRNFNVYSNHTILSLGVNVDNITNANYQWIRGYVTPGTVYTLQVKLTFK